MWHDFVNNSLSLFLSTVHTFLIEFLLWWCVQHKSAYLPSQLEQFVGCWNNSYFINKFDEILEDFYHHEPQYSETTIEEIDPVTGAK